MYVIYINDRPLTLLSENEQGTGGRAFGTSDPRTHLTARYNGKARTLLNYADMLEKGSPKVRSVDIVSKDLEGLWEDFKSHYRWLPAAGGLVQRAGDEAGSYLFIFRRGHWDLPKGKIDPGEDAPTAAIREVREETGLRKVTLRGALPTTFHTYRNRKEKRILKPTFWFRMEAEEQPLVPQTAEDIELAQWRTIADTLEDARPMYANLKTLLAAAGLL